MKYLEFDGQLQLAPDSTKTFKDLPQGFYRIKYDEKHDSYSLVRANPLTVDETVYGIHQEKVDKVKRSYNRSSRSLGVILSGDKGIGKSLFARMLCSQMEEDGYPVIIVDSYYKGIGSFLDSIDTECLYFFDEFDKIFKEAKGYSNSDDNNNPSKQDVLLSLFDGTSSTKRMFIVTCNDYKNINSFLVNRPGRFHYHFRFEYPTSDEIKLYIHDKLGNDEKYDDDIKEIIAFSKKVPLNYDCLRSIVFELEDGGKFKEFINDLNILNTREENYHLKLTYENGYMLFLDSTRIDMFATDMYSFTMYSRGSRDWLGSMEINPSTCNYDFNRKCYIANLEDVKVSIDKDEEKILDAIGESKLVEVAIFNEHKDMTKFAV
jgi:SpoVK/Ycf46/Vps4 family AAA+-type ATPase